MGPTNSCAPWRNARKSLRSEIAREEGRLSELDASKHGKTIDALQVDIAQLRRQLASAEAETRRLETARVDAIERARKLLKDPVALGALGETARGLKTVDFRKERHDADIAEDRTRAEQRIQEAQREDTEEEQIRQKRINDAKRAKDMLLRIRNETIVDVWLSLGKQREADVARVHGEYEVRKLEIALLSLSESQKTELLEAAALERDARLASDRTSVR
jgi:hypothetical protein